MSKKILITGATSGIGLETAKALASQGHSLLVHGRSATKVEALERALLAVEGVGPIQGYVADLSRLSDVQALAKAVVDKNTTIDVLINNGGVFKTSMPTTPTGMDVRFAVNTFAPFLLTKRLLPALGPAGRVINLSSAAQNAVDLGALTGRTRLTDFEAYAQSKLAMTMWSCHWGRARAEGPVIVAVNPGSMLGTNMVKEGFGVAGKDVGIGASILVKAALDEQFSTAHGAYFDNDAGKFAQPHPDAMDAAKCDRVVGVIERLVDTLLEDPRP